jgi:hypothetical protein
VTFAATGHPSITGRHTKTLEVTAAPEITGRASCVVGTAARIPVEELRVLRGMVRVELFCDGLSETVDGEVNPHYSAPDRLVLRRSAVLAPDTFLVNASRSAADLDRSLIGAVADPSATLRVTAWELADPDPVVLVVVTPAAPAAIPAEVMKLADQVDAVVDLAGSSTTRWGDVFPSARWLHGTGRLTATDLPRTTAVLVRDLDQIAGHVAGLVRVVVWPAATPGAELLAAAGAQTYPVLHAGPIPARTAARHALARRIEQSVTVAVVTAYPNERPAALDLIGRLSGHAVIGPDPSIGWGVAATRSDPPHEESPVLAGLDRYPVLAFVPHQRGEPPLVARPDTLARLLRDAGLSGRSIGDVLVALGGNRGQVYRPR